MPAIIAALVSLGCALVVLGLVVRGLFGSATVLKVGGLCLVLAILPAVVVGLFTQMSSAAPGGGDLGAAGSILAAIGLLAIVAVISYLVLAARGLVSGRRPESRAKRGGYRLDDEDAD